MDFFLPQQVPSKIVHGMHMAMGKIMIFKSHLQLPASTAAVHKNQRIKHSFFTVKKNSCSSLFQLRCWSECNKRLVADLSLIFRICDIRTIIPQCDSPYSHTWSAKLPRIIQEERMRNALPGSSWKEFLCLCICSAARHCWYVGGPVPVPPE